MEALLSPFCLRRYNTPRAHAPFPPACPQQIHAQNKQIAAAKAAMALAFEGGSSEFEELSCQGEAYDPARPNDYMEYCKVRMKAVPHDGFGPGILGWFEKLFDPYSPSPPTCRNALRRRSRRSGTGSMKSSKRNAGRTRNATNATFPAGASLLRGGKGRVQHHPLVGVDVGASAICLPGWPR